MCGEIGRLLTLLDILQCGPIYFEARIAYVCSGMMKCDADGLIQGIALHFELSQLVECDAEGRIW